MKIFYLFTSLFCSLVMANSYSGLVETTGGTNRALLVGAPNGLPGVDLDLNNIKSIATLSVYNYQTQQLFDSEATKDAVSQKLTETAKAAGKDGSFYFYFSGHGNTGIIAVGNEEIMQIDEIRNAIQAGRADLGPLQRMVVMFDSCFSGSMINPLEPTNLFGRFPVNPSLILANNIVEAFHPAKHSAYWTKLFAFASATDSQECEGDDNGGMFTQALKKAFTELSPTSATIGDLVSKTQSYTTGSQPTARLVPDSLASEKLHD